MPFKILPTKEFEKDFKKLGDRLKGSFRIRIGSLRIVYSFSEEKKEMYPEKIVFGHKY